MEQAPETTSPIPFSTRSNDPRGDAPLPPELLLQIFKELVFQTGSSTSLFPCMYTCKVFHDILIGEPTLWTRLCADRETANPYFTTCTEHEKAWPELCEALPLSRPHPFTLEVNFMSGLPEDSADMCRMHDLTSVLLSDFERCEEIAVFSSQLCHVENVVGGLHSRIVKYPFVKLPKLRRFVLDFLPPPGIKMNADDLGAWIYTLLNCPLHPDDPLRPLDTSGKEKYNDKMFPNLEEVVLQNMPFSDWSDFSATRLTVLRIINTSFLQYRLTPDDLKTILMLNTSTLKVLELARSIGSSVQTSLTAERYTLPILEELVLSMGVHRNFIPFIQSIDLPSLKRLYIEDFCNNKDREEPVEAPTIEAQTACLESYAAMMNSWPLEQVTELTLDSVIFHEMEGNQTSRLSPSHTEKDTWEDGFPLATRFFYKLSSVRSFRGTVDRTTWLAMCVPPRRFNATLDTFDDVEPILPLMPRPPGWELQL